MPIAAFGVPNVTDKRTFWAAAPNVPLDPVVRALLPPRLLLEYFTEALVVFKSLREARDLAFDVGLHMREFPHFGFLAFYGGVNCPDSTNCHFQNVRDILPPAKF